MKKSLIRNISAYEAFTKRMTTSTAKGVMLVRAYSKAKGITREEAAEELLDACVAEQTIRFPTHVW